MDSFDRLNNDVICDDNITSAKCMGYLSRMRVLCEGMCIEDEIPEHVTVSNCIDLPRDFFGEVLNVGDKVRKWPTSDQVEFYKDQVYYIQALELWEDGWHVNIADEYGDDCDNVWPTELCKYSKPTVEEILLDFAYEFEDTPNQDAQDVVDRYAKKLQLKEDK